MKKTLWILLALNALLLVYIQWGERLLNDGRSLKTTALNEEKISLLLAPQSSNAAATALAPPAAARPIAMSPAAASAPAPADKPGAAVCMEWGEFSGAELNRASASLNALQLGKRLSRREIESSIGFWVYIPAIKGKTALNKKLAELKTLHVEYFVEKKKGQEGGVISLGVFKTRDAAQRFLEKLRAKKIHSAKVGEKSGKSKASVFVLNGLDAPTSGKLAGLQKEFPGSELKSKACH